MGDSSDFDRVELEKLMGRLRDGQLSDQEIRDLDGMLQASAETREYYLDCMAVLAALRMTGGQAVAPMATPSTTLAGSTGDVADCSVDSVRAIQLGQPGLWLQGIAGPIAAVAVVLLVLCVGVVGYFLGERRAGNTVASVDTARHEAEGEIGGLRGEKRAPHEPAPRPSLAGPFGRGGRGTFVADVTGTTNATWATGPSRRYYDGMRIEEGDVLDLLDGQAVVTFGVGAEVVLWGPAKLRVDSASLGTLLRGRMAARVPEEAIGQFAIRTAACEIVDQGTEFGVEVDQAGATTVAVFDGKVDLKWHTPAAGNAARGQRRLEAGRSVRVATTGLSPRDMPASVWPSHSLVDPDFLDVDIYTNLVLADHPIAYWPLREVTGLTAQDLVVGHDGLCRGNIQRPDDDSPLRLDGKDDFVEVPYSEELSGEGSFSVEFWAKLKVHPDRFQSVLCCRDRQHQRLSGFVIYSTPDGWQFWTGSGVSGDMWHHGPALGSVRDGWTHVIAVFDAEGKAASGQATVGRKRLFVDGQCVDASEEMLVRFARNSRRPLRIGAGTTWRFQPAFLCDGMIADVAIYDRALAEGVITKHFAVGRERLTQPSSDKESRP